MQTRDVLLLVAFMSAASASAQAQQQTPPRPPQKRDSTYKLPTVQVVETAAGLGQSRALNALGKVELRAVTAGTSGLKAVEKLPGVNFQSADPWGAYEWSNRVTIRGFQTQQIGQTFDGLPLGDMSYGNFNGLGIGRAVDSDNLRNVGVAQGSGALGTASANNLGGVVQYVSDAPALDRTLSLRQTLGGANTYRTSLRWDTGLWTSGTRGANAFLSFSRQDNDKWKGGFTAASPVNKGILNRGGLFRGGQTWQEQVNGKVLAFAGQHKFTGYYSFSNRSEADYADLSLARFKSSGRDWDQYGDWNTARAAAVSDTPDEAYWQSALGARRDNLAYLLADFGLGSTARLSVQPYIHNNLGNGDWTAPSYGSTWSPDPIYFRQTQYDGKRRGANVKLDIPSSRNHFEAGLWYESNTTNIRRVGWGLQDFATGPAVNFNNIIRLFFDRTGEITTTLAYAQNTSRLANDRLRLTYGAKYVNVEGAFKSNGNTKNAPTFGDPGRPNLDVTAKATFLPQLGAVWSVNATEELFANYSENMNQFPLSPQTGVYNLSPAGFDAFKQNVKPERASSVDVGIRTRRSNVEASLASYYVSYRNRLVGIANCQLTATCASVFSNVGGITTLGLEGLLILRPGTAWTWSSSAALNSSKINDNYTSGTTTVNAKDKTVVDAPSVIANSSMRYSKNAWSGSTGMRYVAKRYFSILNDISVPSYAVADAGLEYRFGRVGVAKDVSLQLNVNNLFDKAYISTVGTGGFTTSGDTQTLMAGSRRLVFFAIAAAF